MPLQMGSAFPLKIMNLIPGYYVLITKAASPPGNVQLKSS